MTKRKRHTPEQIIRKLGEADTMLAAGKGIEHVCQALEVSESTLSCCVVACSRLPKLICWPFKGGKSIRVRSRT